MLQHNFAETGSALYNRTGLGSVRDRHVDGYTFITSEFGAADTWEAAPVAVPDGTNALLLVDDAPATVTVQDRHRHWLAVLVAGVAHVALIAALLPARTDAMGDGGVTLETIAVSIVDTVPKLSAPETVQSETSLAPPDAVTDDANSEAPPDAPATKPEEAAAEPKPQKQALALDIPPETVPPPPDALALPARPPDAERDPPTVVTEEPPPARDEPRERAFTAPAPPPAPAALSALPSQSSAEASSGVVRAYAGSVSRVLERQKPRNRGIKGQVRVQFVIGPSGRAEPPLVLATSGSANLDSLVVTAIQSMNFPLPPPEMSLRQRTFNVPFAFR